MFFLEGVEKSEPAWLKLMSPFYAGTEMLLVKAAQGTQSHNLLVICN